MVFPVLPLRRRFWHWHPARMFEFVIKLHQTQLFNWILEFVESEWEFVEGSLLEWATPLDLTHRVDERIVGLLLLFFRRWQLRLADIVVIGTKTARLMLLQKMIFHHFHRNSGIEHKWNANTWLLIYTNTLRLQNIKVAASYNRRPPSVPTQVARIDWITMATMWARRARAQTCACVVQMHLRLCTGYDF